jgi:uncharacterized protein YukJ
MSGPVHGYPLYNESLDSDNIDPDLDFREFLRLLNAAGIHTVSSCQGHAPGTQWPDVQEWMDPYVTCHIKGSLVAIAVARDALSASGGTVSTPIDDPGVRASFPRGHVWRESVNRLHSHPIPRSVS